MSGLGGDTDAGTVIERPRGRPGAARRVAVPAAGRGEGSPPPSAPCCFVCQVKLCHQRTNGVGAFRQLERGVREPRCSNAGLAVTGHNNTDNTVNTRRGSGDDCLLVNTRPLYLCRVNCPASKTHKEASAIIWEITTSSIRNLSNYRSSSS